MASETTEKACSFVVGDDGLATWSDTHKDAWIGLLETHKRLTRLLEAELESEFGLSLSGVEVLGRLAAAENRRLRLTVLAKETGLSLSRVSRIVDMLELRELVERTSCPEDARAVNAELKPAGLELVRKAQSAHFAGVQERFFSQLSDTEIQTLAGVFSRFASPTSGNCTG